MQRWRCRYGSQLAMVSGCFRNGATALDEITGQLDRTVCIDVSICHCKRRVGTPLLDFPSTEGTEALYCRGRFDTRRGLAGLVGAAIV